ncbi:sentrin-specific protease 1 isoform X1 [Oncorhynchus mykiss]|uniref:SUMO specific peptidase 1 n=1 Tax=Oncorhynchus mykiss TaxID=8022 RepID=A0A8C7PDV3_ONCMY|nr:sentrin-specific protease 1 isoform X1 [Oncorhynchus mykiss]
MFNKFYEWIGTGFANLRYGLPAPDQQDNVDTHGIQQRRPIRRKRPIDCLEDGEAVDHDDQALAVKKFRMGDLVDTVKTAAEGVKSHSADVASWVRNSVTPTLRNILPASPGPLEEHPGEEPPEEPLLEPSTFAPPPSTVWEETEVLEVRNSTPLDGTVAPSTTLKWKSSKSGKTIVHFLNSECLCRLEMDTLFPPFFTAESYSIEKSMVGSTVCRRKVCMALTHREAPKTNGHSVSQPPSSSSTSKPCPSPHPGRTHFRTPTSNRRFTSAGLGTGSGSITSIYEKTFPIRVVQSPSHGSSSYRLLRARARCTAQESVREEEKEVYRQLLAMVSGGQSSSCHNGSSHGFPHSHRDFTSFLNTSRRLLQCSSPAGSGDASRGPSGPPSPCPESSQGYSNVPSPGEGSSGAWNQPCASDSDLSPRGQEPVQSAPSPVTILDTFSQDSQSSAHDGDSVIIVKEQKGKRPDSSSVPCFQAELWIKELSSMYDFRARERRRQIEGQEALTAQLLRQRISDDSQLGHRAVELHVRVPLEKEVPLAPFIEEPKPTEEKPEFPELTEDMEGEVGRALTVGSQDEVLSEGFRLTITRKDLQTLSHLNWLNDEVINFYMNLLVERSKDPSLPTVHTFNTFFFPKLRSAGYSAVRRWTKKMDIFSMDVILVPVHLGVHWCLSVVDLRKKSITYFDSMGGNNDEACRILLQYLQQESKDKKGKDLDTAEWTVQSKKRHEIPQQMNGNDCGMFTCKYAEYVTKDKPITFTQKHMPYFRRRMVWEILNRKLL